MLTHPHHHHLTLTLILTLILTQAKSKQESGRAGELVPTTPSEHLEQWDALSGIMENQELRELLAMGKLSLAECYEQIRLLFVQL